MAITFKDFNGEDARDCIKLVDYFEGEQEDYLIKILDGKDRKGIGQRKEWRSRGIVPRFRNIIKPIIQKSGRLFNNPPSLEVWLGSQMVVDTTLQDLLYQADWVSFFQNVDLYTRLLGTTVVLSQQWIPNPVDTVGGIYKYNKQNGEKLLLTLLHQGNCCVNKNIAGDIIEFAYMTDDDSIDPDDDDKDCDSWTYRYINTEVINDYLVKDNKEILINTQPNTLGVIPITIFYDTSIPVCNTDVFNEPPDDLINIQEAYNLALTDTNFAIAWQKNQTLFINAKIKANDSGNLVPYVPLGHTDGGDSYSDISMYSDNGSGSIGGLGTVTELVNDDMGNQPFVEFKGPDADLRALHDIMRNMVDDVARDWCVNLKYDGQGSANSGFQLIVEEIDNLTLRETRGWFFQAGFNRLYNILRVLYPELTQGMLVIRWSPPALPVNDKEVEDIWSQRIRENRASNIDYFMDVQNMTKDEAIQKFNEILEYNKMMILIPTNQTRIPD